MRESRSRRADRVLSESAMKNDGSAIGGEDLEKAWAGSRPTKKQRAAYSAQPAWPRASTDARGRGRVLPHFPPHFGRPDARLSSPLTSHRTPRSRDAGCRLPERVLAGRRSGRAIARGSHTSPLRIATPTSTHFNLPPGVRLLNRPLNCRTKLRQRCSVYLCCRCWTRLTFQRRGQRIHPRDAVEPSRVKRPCALSRHARADGSETDQNAEQCRRGGEG